LYSFPSEEEAYPYRHSEVRAAADSVTAAAGWVQENVAHLIPNAPQVTSGSTAGVSTEVHA